MNEGTEPSAARPARAGTWLTTVMAVALAGCHGGASPVLAPPAAAECSVTGREPFPNELTVAIAEAADPLNAPFARNAAERLIFRQLYETLVDVDCRNTVVPGLAQRWTPFEQGRVWQFVLREGARFWDGTPVLAQDVAESWSALGARLPFQSVRVLSDRELRVEFAMAQEAHVFAQPALAVARPQPGSRFPLGSGAFRPDSVDTRGLRIVNTPAGNGKPLAIEFRVVSADPRRALDAGVDLLVTSNTAVLEYARALPDYIVSPLSWSHTYALLARGADPPGAADVPLEAQQALARDVVRSDARAPEPPFWSSCDTVDSPRRGTASANTILYDRSDPMARSLAERLAALSWPAQRAPDWLRALLPSDYARSSAPIAVGETHQTLLNTVRTGQGLAVVVALPRRGAAACSLAQLAGGELLSTLSTSAGWRAWPLLDARESLVHHRSVGTILLDGDGILRLRPIP